MIRAVVALLALGLVIAHPILLLAVVPIAWFLLSHRTGASGAMTARIAPGHYPKQTARHEAGHVAAARRLGLGVSSAVVNRDGSGYVQCRRGGTPAQHIGFLRAGEYAIHSGYGAGPDRARVDAILRRVPKGDRRRVLREGERLGRSAANSAGVSGIASKLERNGKL